jgi:hypothetical protein
MVRRIAPNVSRPAISAGAKLRMAGDDSRATLIIYFNLELIRDYRSTTT